MVWRVLATIAAWMILGGFVVFPVAIDDRKNNLGASRFALSMFATSLLVVGYFLSLLLWFSCNSWLFLLDAISLPCLQSCALGLFSVFFNIVIRDLQPLDSLAITVVSIAASSTVLYAITAAFVYRRILIVEKSDRQRRRRGGSGPDDASALLPEDEMQRRQLLRLLLKQDSDRAPSPEASQNTFRIDLPDAMISGRGEERYLALPQNTYEGRSRSQPPPQSDRMLLQMQSMPAQGGHVRTSSSATHSREPSPSSRELRRAEIEQGVGSRESSRGREAATTVPRILRVQTDGWNPL